MKRTPIKSVEVIYETPPSRKECGEALCWECMGHWTDGKVDCGSRKCPFYQYQPYRKLEPNFWWRQFNPKHKGKVTWEDCKREMTEEQIASLKERGRRLGESRKGKK
jgi:hypothetical protein